MDIFNPVTEGRPEHGGGGGEEGREGKREGNKLWFVGTGLMRTPGTWARAVVVEWQGGEGVFFPSDRCFLYKQTPG